jgi:WD40 repeat protein
MAALFVPLHSAHAEEPMATQPEECVFLTNPAWFAVDCMPEEHLFLMANQSGIYAFDTRSGAKLWQCCFASAHTQMQWGRKHVLCWKKDRLFLLDKSSGRELWSRQETRYGGLLGARLWPGEARVFAYCGSEAAQRDGNTPTFTLVLYDLDGPEQRVLGEIKDAYPAAFLADGRTVLFQRVQAPVTLSSQRPATAPSQFFFLDVDNGKRSEGHMLPGTGYGYAGWNALSESGLLAMAFWKKDCPTGLKLYDARSGALVRDLGEMPDMFGGVTWSADEKCLYFLTLDRKGACVVDSQTGAIQQTLSRPGHTLFRVRIQRPDEGPDMVLSQDEDHNFWIWPPSPDATPTMVFDGGRLFSGSLGLSLREDGYALVTDVDYNPVTGQALKQFKLTAYLLDGLKKNGTWMLPTHSSYSTPSVFNRTMTHYADVSCKEVESWKPENRNYAVYSDTAEAPVCSGPGNPLALSPDGRFLVVQIDGKSAVLRDTSAKEQEAVCSFAVKCDDCDSVSMHAVFSDDGMRMAVAAYPNFEIVYLTDGYPRRSLVPEKEGDLSGNSFCFSPNGKRFLAGAYGRACLFDADTGALLHAFQETERYAETWRGWGGETLDGIANRARDWAGLVTDRFKTTKRVEVAFGRGGATIITHAVGQIIRVWDGNTYALLQTIKTELPEKRDDRGDIVQNLVVLNPQADYAFCYNRINAGLASLWSLNSGALVRRYKLAEPIQNNVVVSDDGTSVYLVSNGQLYRWPGRPKDTP